MKKTFKRFLEYVGGFSYDCKCVICQGAHLLKSPKVLMRFKVFIISSFIGTVEFRNKSFVQDLKIFFTIVDCFLGRFLLGFLL